MTVAGWLIALFMLVGSALALVAPKTWAKLSGYPLYVSPVLTRVVGGALLVFVAWWLYLSRNSD